MKIIKVDEETHRRLKENGTKGDTFNDIIKRFLDQEEVKKIS